MMSLQKSVQAFLFLSSVQIIPAFSDPVNRDINDHNWDENDFGWVFNHPGAFAGIMISCMIVFLCLPCICCCLFCPFCIIAKRRQEGRILKRRQNPGALGNPGQPSAGYPTGGYQPQSHGGYQPQTNFGYQPEHQPGYQPEQLSVYQPQPPPYTNSTLEKNSEYNPGGFSTNPSTDRY